MNKESGKMTYPKLGIFENKKGTINNYAKIPGLIQPSQVIWTYDTPHVNV